MIISKKIGNLEPYRSDADIVFSTFYHIYIDLQHKLDKVFFGFLQVHRVKPCQLDQIWVVSYHFVLALSCFLIQLFSYYGNREVNRQPSFRTEDS